MGAKVFGILVDVGKMDQPQPRAAALHPRSGKSGVIGMPGAKCFAILIKLRDSTARQRGSSWLKNQEPLGCFELSPLES